MKRIFTTMLIAITATALMAQMNIWRDGMVISQYEYTGMDSVTFGEVAGQDIPSIADGLYIMGAAVGVNSLLDENMPKYQLAVGQNEVTKKPRNGMYEKFFYLEANQPFSLVQYRWGQGVLATYSANLALTDAVTDSWVEYQLYKGSLQLGGTMQVPVSGLYHVVVDMNLDGKLDNTGGAQILVIPCTSWGVRGTFNYWNYTEMEVVSSSSTRIVYRLSQLALKSSPYSPAYNITHGYYWKVQLDDIGWVKAESTIGTNASYDGGPYTSLAIGGREYPVPTRGIYDIYLTWELAEGEGGNSFSHEAIKVAEYPYQDPTTWVAGISGEGLFDAEGTITAWSDPQRASLAVYSATESTVTDETTKSGTYVYHISGLNFDAGSLFKFRLNGNWYGMYEVGYAGVNLSTSNDCFVMPATSAYDIKITVRWDGENDRIETMYADFIEVDPATLPEPDYVSGSIYVQDNSDGQGGLNIYGWSPDNNGDSRIFGHWPGTAYSSTVVINDVTYYVFTYTQAIENGGYKFILNGTNWQTSDPDWTVVMTGQDLFLRLNADRTIDVL